MVSNASSRQSPPLSSLRASADRGVSAQIPQPSAAANPDQTKSARFIDRIRAAFQKIACLGAKPTQMRPDPKAARLPVNNNVTLHEQQQKAQQERINDICDHIETCLTNNNLSEEASASIKQHMQNFRDTVSASPHLLIKQPAEGLDGTQSHHYGRTKAVHELSDFLGSWDPSKCIEFVKKTLGIESL